MNSNAQNFTRTPGVMAEPMPEPNPENAHWKTPLDRQLDYQPCTARRVAEWGFSVPVRLRRISATEWEVPAHAWHPGEHVELGPLPEGVTVRFELPHPRPDYAPFLNLAGVLG